MKIINLVENTAGKTGCGIEHGLSFYIETPGHRILMDSGASGLFAENAEKLGVRLALVDTVVLSHGHYDHGGGLAAFRAINPNAAIYMQASAGGPYYSTDGDAEHPHYIGLSEEAKSLGSRIPVPAGGIFPIDTKLSLFSGIGSRYPVPKGNKKLKIKTENGFENDCFEHEQCLVIREGETNVLFSGCAHHGILNILDRFRELYGCDPDYVISGFHMMQKSGYSDEDLQLIRDTAKKLTKAAAVFYTGHCTDLIPFEEMKKIMGSQLRYVHSGDEILLNV